MKSSVEIGAIMKKLLGLQLKFMVISKQTDGQRGKYTKYDALISKAKPLFTENNIVLLQPTGFIDGQHVVSTRLYDTDSDQWIESDYPVMLMDVKSKEGASTLNEAQQAGGGMSYAKRYALTALLAWATGDYDYDDVVMAAQDANNQNYVDEVLAIVDNITDLTEIRKYYASYANDPLVAKPLLDACTARKKVLQAAQGET